jgi:hypothetical protein
MEGLDSFRKTDLRRDVLLQCTQLNKVHKVIPTYISEETVLRMVSARIEKMVKNRKVKKNWS